MTEPSYASGPSTQSRFLVATFILAVLFGLAALHLTRATPPGWPEPALVKPPGSTMLFFRKFTLPSEPTTVPASINHCAYLKCGSNLQSVTAHVESCLQPLGYRRSIIGNPQTYISPDGFNVVRVSDSDRLADYVISVSVHSQPFKYMLENSSAL